METLGNNGTSLQGSGASLLCSGSRIETTKTYIEVCQKEDREKLDVVAEEGN